MQLDIAIAPAAAADDHALVAAVTDLINRVYAASEGGLWRDGAARTSTAEVAGLVRAGEIVTATVDGALVGVVRVQRLGDGSEGDGGGGGDGEFGMLAADPEQRGVGIGRALLAFVEDWARSRGLPGMQLELLVPRAYPHPDKEFLRGWYERSGYRVVRVAALEEGYPALAPLLATPCDFVIYRKPLTL